MRLSTVSTQNFRCFGPHGTTVDLSGEVTALVGANGTGKTALLMALSRMFGVTQSQRTITRSDFHKPVGTSSEDGADRQLVIEVLIEFPELSEHRDPADTIPPTFNQMIVTAPGEPPVCRIRLEATWVADGTAEGTVEQRQYWVLTDEEEPAEESKVRLSPFDRGLIQVSYVPADRDPAQEIRYAARTGLGRLMRAISWTDATRRTVREASGTIRDVLTAEQGIAVVDEALQRRWRNLVDEYAANEVSLRLADTDIEQLVREFGVTFFPGDDGRESDLSDLSDGQQSLFYLALVGAIADIESTLAADRYSAAALGHIPDDGGAEALGEDAALAPSGFQIERLHVPALTVFALEEPENHLAPHYLARIIQLLRELTDSGRTQAVFSSHSPAILRRVEPQEVRHFRLDMESRTSIVRAITLPDAADEAGKYVLAAVTAYPELYFAKFVILAEGPSEEVVLPKIAEAREFQIDRSFVSVVPLGGRHVNHFWRLLTDLNIPHATLLDLDAGRDTGGWARIKYVCEQLLRNGTEPGELLSFERDGVLYELPRGELKALHERSPKTVADLVPWCRHLERFGVYFSGPLDFDLAMLSKFRDVYEGLTDKPGPRIPAAGSEQQDSYIRDAIRTVLGNDASIDFYMGTEWEDLFPWYRYLFLSRSKPAIHLQALPSLNGDRLREDSPAVMTRLLERCRDGIKTE